MGAPQAGCRLSCPLSVHSASSSFGYLAARRLHHDTGRSPRPGLGSGKHSQVGRRPVPDVLERWELHSTVSTTGRVEACWLGRWVRQRSSKGRSWARAPGVRLGTPSRFVQSPLMALARSQDAGRRESAARVAAVSSAPGLPHCWRLRISQSPERVSISSARGWPPRQRQGNPGDGGGIQDRCPDLTTPSLPAQGPRQCNLLRAGRG